MQDDAVIRVIAKVMIPAVMLFALYVQFHGDYGPGGGFQAGVIFAAAFVLNAMIFGLNRGRHVWPAGLNLLAICAGVLLYGLTGIASMLLGANYLDYDVLGATPQSGQHIGILLVEFGVGLTVASVMVALFFTFAGRLTHIRLMAKMQVHEEADQRKSKRHSESKKKGRTNEQSHRPLELFSGHCADDDRLLCRDCARQYGQENGRPDDFPDLCLHALHFNGQSGQWHGADFDRQCGDALCQSAAACTHSHRHCCRRGHHGGWLCAHHSRL